MAEFHDLKSEVQTWNLYTDEKLVSKLDNFLNHMMAQCEIINKNTEQTLYETNAVSIYLSDTFNALSNLSNKKFIENSMAPLEEPQIVPREPKQFQEMTVEKKQENFSKALKNVIDAFSITANDDDTELMKSNTMSMATMFKTGDHLPFIIGSKAFNQDEFIGIVDRTENIDKYLKELNTDALGPDSSPTRNGQYANNAAAANQNMMSRSSSMMVQSQVVSNLPPIPGATNRVAINNTTLGPPPPLQQLLQQYEERGAGAGGAGGRGGLLSEIQQRPANPMGGRGGLLGEIAAAGQDRSERPPNPMGGRGGLLGEIAAAGQDRAERPPNPMGGRGNLLGEIAAAGQERSERPPNPMGGRGGLLGEIAAAGQERSERPPNPMGGRGGLLAEIAQKGQERDADQPQKSFQQSLNEKLGGGGMQGQSSRPTQQYGIDDGPSARRVSDIKSNPLYQPLQPQQQRQNRLFDEDDEEEVGNKDMFRSSNAKKKNFDNLLNPMAGGGNPLLNPMTMSNANPFDPFGLQNPFMPFNPKSAQAQAAVVREETKKQERDSLANMANASVYYEDNNKSKAYEDEKKEEKAPKGGNRLTKLFEDSDDDEESRFTKQRLLSQKYRGDIQPKVEEKTPEPVIQQKLAAPNARVSKLFDDDDEGDFLSKKVTQPKKEPEKPKPKLTEPDEDDFLSKPAAKPKKEEPAVRQSKPTKPSLFDDDDDDIGSLRTSKKPEPVAAKKAQKKGVFDDDDDDIIEDKKPKPAQKPLQTKKSLFDNDDDDVPPPKKIAPPEIKPVVREEPKPIVREEPKPVIYEAPKPVVREEPKIEVREEPKIIEPRPDIRPLAQDVLEIKEEKNLQDSWAAPKTAGTNDLTKLIKAAALAKKKKNSSDESDSDDSDRAPPVKKPISVVQSVIEQEPPKVVEEPKIQTWQEEKPVQREEEPETYSPITNTRGGHTVEVKETIVVEKVEVSHEERHDSEDNVRPSVTKQASGVSSRISDLQSKLNLNMMALKPGEGLPEHMRKAKLSVMREEESPESSHTESRTQSEALTENPGPGGISHMAALEKPAMQTRAKKTITFEDDDEDEAPKEIKKPAMSYNPPPTKVEVPVYEEPPRYTQPAVRTEVYEEPVQTRPSTKKKVAFEDDDTTGADPLGFSPKKPQAPTTSSADDPMSLLRGLQGLGETKSQSKKAAAKDMFRDDDEDLGITRKSNNPKPAAPTMSMSDPNNPMALLSGLKMMDEGRKSTKKGKGKSKLFDDDEDDSPPVLRPSTKVEEPRVSTKARESQKAKLFNDSDEDGDFLKKKPASITKPQQKSKPKGKLFDDSD